MKYAIINSQTKRIVRVKDGNLIPAPDGMESVSISDELASQFEASSEANLFLIDGSLKTLKQRLWIDNPDAITDGIRNTRNQLLQDSDWTQLVDSPLDSAAKSIWATYRQNLRDITENIDENGEVTFPTKPAL